MFWLDETTHSPPGIYLKHITLNDKYCPSIVLFQNEHFFIDRNQ